MSMSVFLREIDSYEWERLYRYLLRGVSMVLGKGKGEVLPSETKACEIVWWAGVEN